jgi:small subunit ribosomal protein S2
MKPFIFDARNGIHIIDLSKTLAQLEAACDFLRETVLKGGRVLFVGTKKQAQQAVRDAVETCGQPFVTERWLGGTLTNLKTIKKSLGRLNRIEKMDADGSINDFVKHEQFSLRREAARLVKNLGGIRHLDTQPEAMFVVDIKREHNAVAEARRLRIPLVAIVDTNCDPDLVDYPIAGNDDAIRSVRLILSVVAQTIAQARVEYESKYGRKKESEPTAEAAAAAEVAVADASPQPGSSPSAEPDLPPPSPPATSSSEPVSVPNPA